MPVKHPVSKLLSSFTDVNQCETCQNFTTVEACAQCGKDQCENCQQTHDEGHKQVKTKQVHENFDELSQDELDILETLRNDLTEQEFEDFISVAKKYLNGAILKCNEKPEYKQVTTINVKENFFLKEEPVYDWSKHEKFTADNIDPSAPQIVQKLLRLNFTPRPYQLRMIQMALRKQNTLVCLQTGAGKTFVSYLKNRFSFLFSLKFRSQVL